MTPTMTIDDRQWKQAARDLLPTSSRSCVDFTNGQALKVTIEAVRRTEKASRSGIRAELGQKTADGKTVAERILAAAFRETGKWAAKGSTMAERVRRFIGARVRSASFIASGWIPARRRLFSVVRQKPPGASLSFAGARQYGEDKGFAKPATFSGLRSIIEAIIVNTALNPKKKIEAPGGNAKPIAVKGLQSALNESARDMIETLRKRLQRDLARFNAR